MNAGLPAHQNEEILPQELDNPPAFHEATGWATCGSRLSSIRRAFLASDEPAADGAPRRDTNGDVPERNMGNDPSPEGDAIHRRDARTDRGRWSAQHEAEEPRDSRALANRQNVMSNPLPKNGGASVPEVPPPAHGSAPWVTLVGYPRNSLVGRYLEGPRDPTRVKRDGYGFTTDPAKAWPFPTKKLAEAKARIIDRHMGWGDGEMVVGPLADEMQNTRGVGRRDGASPAPDSPDHETR